MNPSREPKTILITGASKGFGKLAVRLLLERGHRVIAGLRGGRARLESIFASEVATHGDRLHAVDLHMERPETFAQLQSLIEQKFDGRLDVLVNNAGYGLFGSLEDSSPERLRHQFEVNFFGPALLTRAMLPYLRKSRGRVLNLSSIAGLVTFPFYGSYSASKAALELMSEGLSFELKPLGVQVGLIEPGGFRTEFAEGSKVFVEASAPYRDRQSALERAFTRFSARLGDPARVARLIVRLVECRRVPIRSLVGPDAVFMALLRRFLPHGLRLWLVDLIYRKAVFRS